MPDTRALFKSPAVQVTLGLVLGLALGMLLARDALPAGVGDRTVALLEPVGTAWITAVRMTVIPLVVPLLIVGVAGSDDTSQLGALGRRSFAVFLFMLITFAIGTALIAPAWFAQLTLDPASTARLRESAKIDIPPADALSLRTWILSLIPANPIKAAADGLLLPVVVFTLLYGFALTTIPEASRAAQLAFFRGMSQVMLTMVRWILALAPIGIFALAITIGQKLGAAVIGAIGFYVMVHVTLHVVALVLTYVMVAASGKASVGRFARAALPAQLVAFGSRSSLASLPAMVEGATTHLKLAPAVTAFVLPLSAAVFKVTSAIYWIVGALFIGALYGIPLDGGDIALIGAASVLLSFSTPGIPSGGMLLQVPIYTAVGLPVEGLGILIALDTVPDMFKTLGNVTGDLATAVLVGPRRPSTPDTPATPLPA